MNLAEIIEHEVQANRVHMIFQLLAECVGQASEPIRMVKF
jgi:hypothetical protein